MTKDGYMIDTSTATPSDEEQASFMDEEIGVAFEDDAESEDEDSPVDDDDGYF